MSQTPYFWAKENNHTEIMNLLPVYKYEWNTQLKKLKDNIVYIDRKDGDNTKPPPKPRGKGKK